MNNNKKIIETLRKADKASVEKLMTDEAKKNEIFAKAQLRANISQSEYTYSVRGSEDNRRKINMTIEKKQNGSALTIAVQGRLDTTTAPDLEKEIKNSLDGVTELIMDFEKLDYISSAGLRVLLSAQKVMSKQGTMKVIHVNDLVMEVFEVTGFTDILTIE